MGLKTIKDLNMMKENKMQVYSDEYNYFLREFESDAFSKVNWRGKAEVRLSDFDKEARQQIILDLSKRGVYF